MDIGWGTSEWLVPLAPLARLAWVNLLCYTKASGAGGHVKALGPAAVAKFWEIPSDDLESMLNAAVAAKALVVSSGDWTVVKWSEYQEPDTTAAERQRRHRKARSRLSPLRRDDRDIPLHTVSHGVTRRATETVTVTETETEKKTPTAAARGKKSWRICPEDWSPSDKHLALAAETHIDLDRELAKFREWEFHAPKTDADRAFSRWIRKAGEMGNSNGKRHKPTEYFALNSDPAFQDPA